MGVSSNMGLAIDEELFRAYAFYAGVLLVKFLLMSLLTARQRFKHGVFISAEDIAGKENKLKNGTGINDDVERVRRAHQNDIENILPFIFLGFLYIFTGPSSATATLVFRIFTASRVLHSIVYLLVIPQPARALTFFGGMGVNVYLACKVVTHFI